MRLDALTFPHGTRGGLMRLMRLLTISGKEVQSPVMYLPAVGHASVSNSLPYLCSHK